MVAAPAVEVTLGSSPGLETGRTTLNLDTAQDTFALAFPFLFFLFCHAAITGNKAQLAADVRPRSRPEPRA